MTTVTVGFGIWLQFRRPSVRNSTEVSHPGNASEPREEFLPTYQPFACPARTQRLWVGATLRAVRRRCGWTQSDLAHPLGLSDTTWSRFEQGTLPIPAELIPKLEVQMGMVPGFFVAFGDQLANHFHTIVGTPTWRYRKAEEALRLIHGSPMHTTSVS